MAKLHSTVGALALLALAPAGALVYAWQDSEQSADDPGLLDGHELVVAAVPDRGTGAISGPELAAILDRVRLSEDLIRDFTKRFIRADRALLDLEFTTATAGDLFAPKVLVRDVLAPVDGAWRAGGTYLPTSVEWPLEAEVREVAGDDVALLHALTQRIAYFEHIHFKFVRGDFTDDGSRYTNQVALGGMARLDDDRPCGISGSMEIEWASPEDPEELGEWRIVRWTFKKLQTSVNDRLYFEEVLDLCVDDPELCAALRRSNNQEWIMRHEIEGVELPPGFEYATLEQHPTVTVADIDGNGYEDIFLGSRWDRCYLLMNRGGGKFDEVAREVGLVVPEGAVASAGFADMDNDGDLDVIIGRNRLASLYFVNENGKFVERSKQLVNGLLPGFVSAVAITDYDGDGLLDVYLSTYSSIFSRWIRQEIVHGKVPRKTAGNRGVVDDQDFADLVERLKPTTEDDLYFNLPGTANVLLRGVGGGKLERVRGEMGSAGTCLMNTFGATFADYDNDGDPDLYLANDFAPDTLFRNDAGTFVDVSAEAVPYGVRFGMGVSWGDYDNDGRFDLYVSNMSTKAGTRLISQIPSYDERLLPGIRGNSLIRNLGDGKFDLVSDRERTVAGSGWSYGSQLADIDCDGRLDVFGCSGHYTTPDALSNDEDW